VLAALIENQAPANLDDDSGVRRMPRLLWLAKPIYNLLPLEPTASRRAPTALDMIYTAPQGSSSPSEDSPCSAAIFAFPGDENRRSTSLARAYSSSAGTAWPFLAPSPILF